MDRKQKYVRLAQYNNIIIFPVTIDHSHFKHMNPVSAGFCYVDEKKVSCFGESFTLQMSSHADDSMYATHQLFGFDI